MAVNVRHLDDHLSHMRKKSKKCLLNYLVYVTLDIHKINFDIIVLPQVRMSYSKYVLKTKKTLQ